MPRTYIREIIPNLYLLRVDDTSTRYFEALWSIPEGITYNAYLLLTPKGNVLFDSWKQLFSKDFLDALNKVVEPTNIDYIVVHHAEPDHTGSIPYLLEANKNKAVILGHPLAKTMLESFYNISIKFKPVRDMEEILLGDQAIKFIYTPWLHWPETIMSYLEDWKVLFSCDAFGGYSTPKDVFDNGDVRYYLPFVRKYVATVIGHYREYIVKAIDKLASNNIDPRIIAPGHGLIWKQNPRMIMEYYKDMALAKPKKGKVVIIYSSMYGAVERSIKIAAKILEDNRIKPRIFRFTDRYRDSLADILGEVLDAEALIVGAATYEANMFPYMEYVVKEITWKTSSAKPILVVSSYGWGGIAGKKLKELFSKAGYSVIDVIEIKGTPALKDAERIKVGVEKLLASL